MQVDVSELARAEIEAGSSSNNNVLVQTTCYSESIVFLCLSTRSCTFSVLMRH